MFGSLGLHLVELVGIVVVAVQFVLAGVLSSFLLILLLLFVLFVGAVVSGLRMRFLFKVSWFVVIFLLEWR